MRLLHGFACLLLPALSAGAADGFAKYQVIVDKMPFGRPPEKPVIAPPPPVVDTYAWISDYRMTFMTQTVDNKAKVGLQNVKDQTTLSIESGETHPSGIQLLAVNYDERAASLSKGGQTHSIKLQDPAAAAPAAQPGAPGSPRIPPSLTSQGRGGPPPSFARPPRPNTPPPPPATPVAATEAPQRLTGEQLEQHLQDYQVEVLRKGLPPLPVKLTPENDARLVQEGVLPALEAPAAPPGQ